MNAHYLSFWSNSLSWLYCILHKASPLDKQESLPVRNQPIKLVSIYRKRIVQVIDRLNASLMWSRMFADFKIRQKIVGKKKAILKKYQENMTSLLLITTRRYYSAFCSVDFKNKNTRTIPFAETK